MCPITETPITLIAQRTEAKAKSTHSTQEEAFDVEKFTKFFDGKSYDEIVELLNERKEDGISKEQILSALLADKSTNIAMCYSDEAFDSFVKKAPETPSSKKIKKLREHNNTWWTVIAATQTTYAPEIDLGKTNSGHPHAKFTRSDLPAYASKAKTINYLDARAGKNGQSLDSFTQVLNSNHSGALDIFHPDRIPICAVKAGTVIAVGNDWQAGKPGTGISGKSGNGLTLATPMLSARGELEGTLITHYYHFKNTTQKSGDFVEAGDPIGIGSNTGSNAIRKPPHLHIEMKVVANSGRAKTSQRSIEAIDMYQIFTGDKSLDEVWSDYTRGKNRNASAKDADFN